MATPTAALPLVKSPACRRPTNSSRGSGIHALSPLRHLAPYAMGFSRHFVSSEATVCRATSIVFSSPAQISAPLSPSRQLMLHCHLATANRQTSARRMSPSARGVSRNSAADQSEKATPLAARGMVSTIIYDAFLRGGHFGSGASVGGVQLNQGAHTEMQWPSQYPRVQRAGIGSSCAKVFAKARAYTRLSHPLLGK
jgi:hypothetical protein